MGASVVVTRARVCRMLTHPAWTAIIMISWRSVAIGGVTGGWVTVDQEGQGALLGCSASWTAVLNVSTRYLSPFTQVFPSAAVVGVGALDADVGMDCVGSGDDACWYMEVRDVNGVILA